MKRFPLLPVVLLSMVPWLATAVPRTVEVKNPSFENNAAALAPLPGNFSTNNIPLWTAAGGAGLYNPNTPVAFAPEGIEVVYLNTGASISQALTLEGGGAVTASPGAVVKVSLQARPRTLDRTSTLTVDLRVGTTSISAAPATIPLASNNTGYHTVNATVTMGDAAKLGAAQGQPVTLFISNAGDQTNVDTVSATVTSPPVITSFTALPSPATPGGAVTLSWTVTGATSLLLDGVDVTGDSFAGIAAPAAPATHTLSATSEDGTATASVLVDVLPAALPVPAVRINEAVTENTAGPLDEDGTRQDWLELYNTTAAPADLTGWHLTDDPAAPAKWTFPATIIPANGYLLIFASGKNRLTSPLHTNFKLDNDGEYLALTRPDGSPVSFLTIPKLAPDQSYGPGLSSSREPLTVSPANAALRWTVPLAPVPEAWRGGAAFDDSTWTPGQWMLGFDNTVTTACGSSPGMAGTQAYSGVLGMDFDVARAIEVTELGCFDALGDGLKSTISVQIWRRNQNNTPAIPNDDTGIAAMDLDPVAPGIQATLTFSGTDGLTLVGSHRFRPLSGPVTLPPGAYTIAAFNYGTAEMNGNVPAVFSTFADTGGGAIAFVGNSRFGTVQGAFPGSADGGPAVRYGAGSFRFRPAFDTSAGAAMSGINATVLTRARFTLPAGQRLFHPVLKVTADDGFVAWINGTEVARRNAPATLAHDSAATAAQWLTEEISLEAFASAIHSGENILAIQGLNVAADDPDFRLQASLSGEGGAIVPVFLTAATPGAENSGGLSATGVVINEIHSDVPDSKSRFVEFVELYNPLATPVDLGGWRLGGGIGYAFPPGAVIPAGGYVVIAENPAALASALGYPDALGPWTGGLKNEGDEIVLRNAADQVVDRVTYGSGFPWPTTGDAPGNSLQRLHEGLDGDLGGSWRGALPTPGARNAVTTGSAPPAIRQVTHTPEAPRSGEAVTVSARITDPDGIAAAWLEYQIVEPGNYLRLTDAAASAGWVTLPMHDDGLDGDTAARDGTFTATVPGSVQTHRRLIRYRIRSWDGVLNEVRVPYADDPSPNFAWFCYDDVPAWTGAVRPGVTPADTFPAATMAKVRPWHLLSNAADVQNCQYSAAFNDGTYRFEGALVIDGKVYDHIHYRVKGQNSTFNTGKNKWKLRFNRGHYLKMPDDYGLTRTTVRTLNLSSVPAPWAPWNRGMAGLDEAVAFRLSNLAGAPAPHTSYVQWRVIDGAVETNAANQYDGDLWGLYLAFENMDNQFKDAHGLPDGNIFRLQVTGAGNSLLGQGKGQPGDLSDLNAFTSAVTGYQRGGGSASVAPQVNAIQPEAWFRANVNLPEYFNWRAVTEAVNQTDRREQENVVYFRDPSDHRWQILPWDVDLLYEQFDRWGPRATQNAGNLVQYEQISRSLLHPAILTEFQNRARELQDLLLNDDQAWKVVDEFVSIITDETPRVIPFGSPIADGFVEVERRRWDYNPVNPTPPRGAGPVGNYYKTPYPIGNQGNGPPQPYNRVLASGDFEGMVQWVKEFIATSPNGGARLAKMAGGEVDPFTLAATAPVAIPATPQLTYTGTPGYPLNQLTFASTAFSSPDGQSFTAIQWRMGEIYDPAVPGFVPGQPWRYEIQDVWTSGELPAASGTTRAFPAAPLSQGRTYRARVRHKDSAGRWSHWSSPVEFTAGTAQPGDLAAKLVVSELMYNPPEGGALEYLALMNIGTTPLDISGVAFTAGIGFTFTESPVLLAPGERAVLVADAAAFTQKYGAGVRVLGTFSGSLSNGGERVVLSLGQSTVLRDFTYSDSFPWPAEADGTGAALALIAPGSNPDHADPLNWRAAPPSPGAAGPGDYAGWKTAHQQPDDNADTDSDGLPAFLEYALGTSPSTPDRAALPTLTAGPDGTLTFTVTRSRAAEVSLAIQSSPDATTWHPTSATLITRVSTPTAETLTFAFPPTPELRQFVRARFFAP